MWARGGSVERTVRQTFDEGGFDAGLFWASVIAVPASTVATIVALSRHLPPGDLAKVSIVFSLSFVAAVLPMAAQAQAAADGAASGAVGRLQWQPIRVVVIGFAIAAPVLARMLGLPLAAVLLPILQVLPAVALGAVRGELISRRAYRSAGVNQLVEAGLRLVGGFALGLAFGSAGVAASLLLATAGAYLLMPKPVTDAGRELVLPTALIASALLTVSVHLDVFLAPRLLGEGADAYAVAALPAKGVFLALMAAGWLVIPSAAGFEDERDAIRPVLRTVAGGLVLGLLASLASPLIGVLLGRGTPDRSLVALLGVSMALAAGSWVCLQIRLTRGSTTLWRPAAIAIGITAVGGALTRSPAGLALSIVAGHLVALGTGTWSLLVGADERTTVVVDPSIEPDDGHLVVPAATRRVSTRSPISREARDAVPDEPRCSRRALAAVSGAIAGFAFLQHPGLIVPETKLDVTLDAAHFLSRTWNLWEPTADMGNVQNQAVGYLFPMGPFFALGQLAQIPPWVLQRAWMGLVLAVAFWGAARLADELEIGSPTGRVLGALAYALSPFFIARVGTTSGMVLGGALLPLVMLPLVRASRIGSIRRGACLSALAVFACGGINGAVTLAVLVMPVLWLLTRSAGRRRTQLAAWWVPAVALATAWWVVPLVFQLRYGFNFLPFTERANTTTAYTSTVEVLRGTADWLSYLHLREAWLPAGWSLVADPVAIVASVAVVAAALFALARRDLPHRLFLVCTFTLGVMIVGAGYGGLFGNPLAREVQAALDGPLGLFRNVYKFQPVIGLPIALGLVHALHVAAAWAKAGDRTWRVARARVGTALPATAAVLVVLAALPLLTGNLTSDKGFAEIPDWWKDAVAAQQRLAPPGRALLVPGVTAADYEWGRSLDEPLQALTDTPWAVRSLIPLGGAGETRVLDAVEHAIERGGDPALEAFLQRAGITYVIARNDVKWKDWNAPRPLQVHRSLLASGLTPAESFGPSLPLDGDTGDTGFAVGEVEHDLHAVEFYKVGGAAMVQTYPVADAAVLSGGPEATLQLARFGLDDRATVLAGDLPPGQDPPRLWIVTDTLRRRYVEFGLMRSNAGFTLGPDEAGPGGRPLEQQLLPTEGVEHQTVAFLDGVREVNASSYGSWLYQIPEVGPINAFDGDPATAWVAGPTRTSAGEWVRLDFDTPVVTDWMDVTLLADGPWRPAVRSLRVTTEAGTAVTTVASDETTQRITVPDGPTDWMKLSFERVDGEDEHSAGAGIREVVIPGVEMHRSLLTPSELIDEWSTGDRDTPIYVFERATADPRSLLRRDEERRMHRRFKVPETADVTITATATPMPSPALFELLGVRDDRLRVETSSTLMDLPEYQPHNLVDARDETIWVAQPTEAAKLGMPQAPGRDALAEADLGAAATLRTAPVPQRVDAGPSVNLSWGEPRMIDTLVVTAAPGLSKPRSVRIASSAGERVAAVSGDGLVRFEPMRTDRLTVSFPSIELVTTTSPLTGEPTPLPLGLAGLRFPALSDLVAPPVDASTTVHVACDAGPELTIDGIVHRFALDTTIGELAGLRPLRVRPCDDERTVRLAPGTHDLGTSEGTAPLQITTIMLRDPDVTPARPTRDTARRVDQLEWGKEARTVRVGAGETSYLTVNENFNKGWQATMGGVTLTPVRIDGWRQAFLVPEGAGGIVEMRFTPTAAYHAALVAGALGVLLLLALALVPDRRRDRPGRLVEATPPWWLLPSLGVVAAVWVAGIAGIATLPLWLALRRRPVAAPWIAAGAMALAGLCVAIDPGSGPGDRVGAFGWPAQVLAGIAFATVVLAAIELPVRISIRRPSGEEREIDLRGEGLFEFEAPEPVQGRPPSMWDRRGWERQQPRSGTHIEHGARRRVHR